MRAHRLVILGLCLIPASLIAGDNKPAPNEDEALLRSVGVAADPEKLLDYFRRRTISDVDRARLAQLIRQLGDDDFQIRETAEKELLALGPKIAPALQRALNSSDQEVRARARHCLNTWRDESNVDVEQAALRLFAARRSPRTAAVLIAYYPDAIDAQVRALLQATLREWAGGDEACARVLAKALDDNHPQRRRLAAVCLAKSQRSTVRKLLDDPDPQVRWHAANAFVQAGDRLGLRTLLSLLEDGPVELSVASDEVLRGLAGASAAADRFDLTQSDDRRRCRQHWEDWCQANQPLLERPGAERPLLGLTTICECADPEGNSRVWECAAGGKPRWQVPVRNPVAVQVLSDNRLLVADCTTDGKVVEFDRQGRVLWTYAAASPVSCQRLPNGNTFIATQTHLFEVTRGGKKVVEFERFARHIHCARKLPDGRIAYLHSHGYLAILDATGRQVRMIQVKGLRLWGSFEVIVSKHFLVCEYSTNRVVEMDDMGKEIWECEVTTPTSAVRLPNGNTVVASGNDWRVIEFDPSGKQVWSIPTRGRPFGVVRR